MRKLMQSPRGWLDYMLVAICCLVTQYSFGMSLSFPELGFAFMMGTGLGFFLSFVIETVFKEKWLTYSPLLYGLVAASAPYIGFKLNYLLPGEGLPRELQFSAGPLIWMLTLCSFVAWRDSTILFQLIPCIALFGLVGAFNTFSGATITFFIFLLCAATLYARSHQRTMLLRAQRSGYLRLEAIHEGPWRKVAGPEWGLASAGIVIALSTLAAPVLQQSVQGVSGVVRFNPPRINPPQNTPSTQNVFRESARVGQGPLNNLSDTEVLRFKGDEQRYLRSLAFTRYDRGLWRRESHNFTMDQPSGSAFPMLDQYSVSDNFDIVNFDLRIIGRTPKYLPVPAPIILLSEGRFSASRDFDAALVINRALSPDVVITGQYLRYKPGAVPKNATSPEHSRVGPYIETSGMSQRVIDLAKESVDDSMSDYEKAQALQKVIESRAKYNLKAEAAPDGEDPVEWFLFGPQREGYCDLFASSMVQMARALQIPARYVTGYYPVRIEDVDEQGSFVVRERDAHAWAELYFEGFGWVPFDPTEGAATVPGGERGSLYEEQSMTQQSWFIVTSQVVVGLMLLGGIVLVLRHFQNPKNKEELVKHRLGRAYARFTAAVERATGQTKYISETPAEYLQRIEPLLVEHAESAKHASQAFEAAFYAPILVDDAKLKSLEETVGAFASEIKKLKPPKQV